MTIHLSNKRCSFCRVTLTVHEAVRGTVCRAASCQRLGLRRLLDERKVALDALQRKALERQRKETLRLLGAVENSQPLDLVILPSDDRLPTRLPKSRKHQFREHLSRLVQAAFQPGKQDLATAPLEMEAPQGTGEGQEAAVLGAACATCRGHCCSQGGTSAYLDVTTVRRFQALRPGLGPRDLIRAYLRHLPVASIPGSCVFHSATGCSLPRQMRASLCNSYYCLPLKALQARLSNSPAHAVLLLAATDREITRSLVWSEPSQVGEPSASDRRVETGRHTGISVLWRCPQAR